MAVFLTGGTGFLGQWLVPALTFRRLELTVLVRPRSDTSSFPPDRVEPVLGDVTDAQVVRAAMKGCDTVIHAAAKTEGSGGKRSDYDRVNVQGFRNVMDAAWHHGVHHVVYVSSFLALGPSFGGIRNEDHMRATRDHPGDHERTKQMTEALTRSYVSGGLPLTVVYPTLLYGPGRIGGGNVVSQLLVDRARGRLGSLPFDNGNRLCLAYVDDVAEGICRALERGQPGERFILGGENRSVYDILRIFTAVGGLRGSNAGSFVATGRRSKLAAFGARLKRRTSPLTKRVLEFMRDDWAYSSARAEERLGYRIRPLPDGLRRTVDYLRECGALSAAATGS